MRGGSAQLLAAMLVRVRPVDGFELSRILVPAQVARLGLTPARVRTELRRGNWQAHCARTASVAGSRRTRL
jgi:hypothetical protein